MKEHVITERVPKGTTHIYLGVGKFYFLREEERRHYNMRLISRVLKIVPYTRNEWTRDSDMEGKQKSHWLNDVDLYSIHDWKNSDGVVVVIGNTRWLRADARKKGVEHIPVLNPAYEFDDRTTLENMLIDIRTDKNVYFVGHGGTGKTSVVEQLAARLNKPCVRLQTSSDMTPESLVGSYVPVASTKGTNIVWKDGLFTQAARAGWWVILDEWDFAPAHIRTVLNGALEVGNRRLTLSDKEGGETLSMGKGIHPDFRVFATGNTAGCMQDDADIYGGSADQNLAQLSRWKVYKVELPSKEDMMKMMQRLSPDLKLRTRERIANAGVLVNTMSLPGVVFSRRTLKDLVESMQAKKSLTMLSALTPVLLNHMPTTDQQMVISKLRAHNIIPQPRKGVRRGDEETDES